MFILSDELVFPNVEFANSDGLLAIGGDLHPDRLQLAYSSGIFPWYSEGEPICWYAPNPRFVLLPGEIKVSKSMEKVLKQEEFHIFHNRNCAEIIYQCSRVKRKGQQGTWITDDMMEAYIALHEKGVVHSIEAWKNGELVGGLYGVVLGSCFFGESMFSKESNASKAAFVTMVRRNAFELIDCQVYTPHLESMGARPIPRKQYMQMLEGYVQKEDLSITIN